MLVVSCVTQVDSDLGLFLVMFVSIARMYVHFPINHVGIVLDFTGFVIAHFEGKLERPFFWVADVGV